MTTSTTSTTSLTGATEELRSGLRSQLGTVLDSFDDGATELAARTWPAKAVGARRRTSSSPTRAAAA